MTENFVSIKDLTFSFHGKLIFDKLNIAVPKGKITAIMGPSGTGKTTLLRLIGGELRPDSGEICINKENIHNLSRTNLHKLRRNIGLLFQNGALFTNLNVYENVAFPLREHTKLQEEIIRALVLMKLQTVGLRGARNLFPSQLSGGMARRVALARAIALDPNLIMYDEPFTGLDPISLGVIVKLVYDINHTLGLTTIIVSHDVPEILNIADYIYVISNGRIIGSGVPKQLERDENPAIKQFMHGLPDGIVPFHYPAPELLEDLILHDDN